jgi:uncharacterized protein (TIGR03382 family)
MKTRAVLLAALVAAPVAAAGQNLAAGVAQLADTEGEVNFIGLAECEGALDDLNWTLNTGTGSFTTGGRYRIFVSNKAPAPSGELAGFCPEADADTGTTRVQIGETFDATAANSTREIAVEAIPAAVGATCSATASEQQAYICVEWFNAAGARAGFANAELTLQFRPPPKPTSVRVDASENALQVNWSAGLNGVESFEYEAIATGDVTRRSGRVRGTSTRLEGLTNDTSYTVVVIAYSKGSNPSEPSDPVAGTPVPINDFWEHYENSGGLDSGGCASGPAGLGAIAGLVLALAFRRRHA